MERFAHLVDQVHDASVTLEQLLLALDRHDRKPTGTNGLKVDKEHAAELVARETGCAVFSLDTAISSANYLSAMTQNIDTIKEALG